MLLGLIYFKYTLSTSSYVLWTWRDERNSYKFNCCNLWTSCPSQFNRQVYFTVFIVMSNRSDTGKIFMQPLLLFSLKEKEKKEFFYRQPQIKRVRTVCYENENENSIPIVLATHLKKKLEHPLEKELNLLTFFIIRMYYFSVFSPCFLVSSVIFPSVSRSLFVFSLSLSLCF